MSKNANSIHICKTHIASVGILPRAFPGPRCPPSGWWGRGWWHLDPENNFQKSISLLDLATLLQLISSVNSAGCNGQFQPWQRVAQLRACVEDVRLVCR